MTYSMCSSNRKAFNSNTYLVYFGVRTYHTDCHTNNSIRKYLAQVPGGNLFFRRSAMSSGERAAYDAASTSILHSAAGGILNRS